MAASMIISTADGRIRGVHNWTEGFKPLQRPRKPCRSEDRILAIASRLWNRGKCEEAEEFLECYCENPQRFFT